MDFGKGLFNVAKFTVGATVAVGEAVGEGVKNVYSTVVSDTDKVKEMKEIAKKCNDLKESLDNKQQLYEESLDKEVRKYNKTKDDLIKKTKVARKYMEFYNEKIIEVSELHDNSIDLKSKVAIDGFDIAKISIGAGGIAGAAVGGGAAGLMAALGTASTGTAISSLSGAAFTNALLASLGGGSIASGGFGIAGGTVVLGSLITIPALVVGGYFADKKINESYEEMKKSEKEAEKLENDCKKIFDVYDSVIKYMHVLNLDFENFYGIYNDVVNASVVAANKDYIRNSYNNILLKAQKIANDYLSIKILDGKNIDGDRLKRKINKLRKDSFDCRNDLDMLERYMTDRERDFVDNMPELVESNWDSQRKYMEGLIEEQKRIIESQREELNRCNEFIGELQQRNAELKAEWDKAKNENERLQLKMKEAERLCDSMRERMPRTFNKFLVETKKKWHFIRTPEVIDSISSAEMLYDMYDRADTLGDYSAVVVQYVKSVEMLLVDVLRFNGVFHEGDVNRGLDYLTKTYITNSSMADNWDYNVGEKIDKVRKIRNKASHKEVIDIDKMHTTRETVIGENDNLNNKIGIVPYMNDLLR